MGETQDRWLTPTGWCYVETMANFFVLVICLGVEKLDLPCRAACHLRWLTVVDRGYRISDSDLCFWSHSKHIGFAGGVGGEGSM